LTNLRLARAARTLRRPNAEAAVALHQRRAWFADAPNPEPPSSGGEDKEQPKSQPGNIGELEPWVQQLIKDLRKEAGDYRMAKKRAEDEKAAEETKRLAEQGKWKELADQRQVELDALKPVQDRLAALEAQLQATNEARIKTIPEAFRTVIPTDYAPERLAGWLDANIGKLTQQPAPNTDAGARGDSKPTAMKLTAEEEQMARAMGVSNDAYAKRKAEIAAQRNQT
jgi:hypothetical protein